MAIPMDNTSVDYSWNVLFGCSNYSNLKEEDQNLVVSVIEQLKGASEGIFDSRIELFKWELSVIKGLLGIEGLKVYFSKSGDLEVRLGHGYPPKGFVQVELSDAQMDAMRRLVGVEKLSDNKSVAQFNRLFSKWLSDVENLADSILQGVDQTLLRKNAPCSAKKFKEKIVREHGSFYATSLVVDEIFMRRSIHLTDTIKASERKKLTAELDQELTLESAARSLVRKHWGDLKNAICLDQEMDKETCILLNAFDIAWDFHFLEDILVEHFMKGECSFFDPKSVEHELGHIEGHLRLLGKHKLIESLVKDHPETSWIHPRLESVQRSLCLSDGIWNGALTKLQAHIIGKTDILESEYNQRIQREILQYIEDLFATSKGEIPEKVLQEKVAAFSIKKFEKVFFDAINSVEKKERIESTFRKEMHDALKMFEQIFGDYSTALEVS